MRKFLAILVCKLGRAVGKLVGKGSSMPGKFALKICPDILRRVQLPPHIIAVTGSNGKTSTVEMIATVLRGQGKNVIYNAEGSNQVEGVTTLILTHATLGGKVNADVLLLESDERYAAHSFKYFHPTEFVITNLYRDQLTRNGHPESVFDAILPAIHPDTELILNGDDPLSSCFAIGHEKVKWFGLNRCATDTETSTGVYHDGAYCPVCHAPMEYEYVHYNHIGAYRCTSCGHVRPDPDYAATELDLQNGKLILDGQFTVALAFRSIYNVYNILAAYAACRECGVEGAAIADTLSSYILKNGRMQTFTLGQHHGTLLTSKHENSIAYDTNLRYIASANEDCKAAGYARVTAVGSRTEEIGAPALYNLTELQKDANRYHNLTAIRVQEITQSLYEKKLISCPRTSSRLLPRDVYDMLPPVMEKLLSGKDFRQYAGMVDLTARKGMTGTQDTAEHHAIVITGVQPGELDREERLVYTLIVGRMLETFMPPCKVEYTTVETVCAARKFRIRTYRILETGWLGVFQREHLVSENCVLCPVPPELLREETLPVAGCSLIHRKSLPVSPYTDEELTDYMDKAGLGTVSTRTNIIRTLLDRKYIRYSGRYIIPTPKGLLLYETVRGMKVAEASLTSGWETELVRIERGELTQKEFLDGVLETVNEVTGEIFRNHPEEARPHGSM